MITLTDLRQISNFVKVKFTLFANYVTNGDLRKLCLAFDFMVITIKHSSL
jgi:hypothetical protein